MRKGLLGIAVALGLVAAAPASAVVSGANGKLLYTLQTSGNYDIWTIEADGSGNAPLVTDAADDQGGSWSPDGTKIVFRSDRTGAGDIYIADANGANQLPLTTDPAKESHPSFSPDGKQIVFTRADPDDEIWVMNANGSDAHRLTDNTIADAGPEWSPDGTRIAYFSGGNVIHVMNADGSNQHVLVPGGSSVGPQWSPDARRILFNRCAGSDCDPYAVNADGTGLVNLGQAVPSSQAPSWSPDGTKIVLLASSSGTGSDIWVMNADGTGAVKVLADGLIRSGPRWQPIPRPPIALTQAPTDLTTASATLNGTIDSTVLHPTTYWFEYGTTTGYGARTADSSAPSPVGQQAVAGGIADLLPFTTYHARLVARNANGTAAGADQSFTTGALAPFVTTTRATAGRTSATLFGLVDPRGAPAAFHFEYGTGTSYGSTTTLRQTPSGAAVEASDSVGALKAGTVYHFRLVATNAGGTTTGADATVRTLPKAAPRSLSARAKPRRDRKAPFRYVFTGRLGLPAGVSAAEGCRGSVSIQVKRGTRRITTRRATLSGSCAYRKVVSLSRSSLRLRAPTGRLKVTSSFSGNAALSGKRSAPLFVRFG